VETPISILQKYWHHSQFRPLQEDIVNSVISGNDTLALLPTGGGKSVCFQVPGLLLEGLCIVISPLIALMKDQVEQLHNKGIHAYALHSGLTRNQIDLILNNCMYGQVKFLYVSPERIQTEIFTERVKQMKIGLIAIDEAHCISQWGYDFRPPYLQIATLRQLKPDVPVIALTASATATVQEDIMARLSFDKDQRKVFKKSFARDNLSFVVRKTENKEKKMIEILQKVKGTAIVYVRSRKATQEVARILTRRNISASYYHAGLTFEERTQRQDDWIKNKTRVIVATNAFGMGIDKPDVRVVIHLDLPENLEAYYQEAGRGGRDGKRAFAVILYGEADVLSLRNKVAQSQPSIEFLKKVYQALANFYQLALGSSQGESYPFDIQAFSERFQFNAVEVYNGLKKLEEEGLIQFNESFYSPSVLHFNVDHNKLYEFQVANAKFDDVIKMMLRLYGGEMFSGYMRITENVIAKSLNISPKELVSKLKHLHELKIIDYLPAKDEPQITFVLPRQDAEHLPVDRKRIQERRELILSKMESMISFTTSVHQCRMLLIQDYFDEVSQKECGICDVCISRRKTDNLGDYEQLKSEIMHVLATTSMAVETLEKHIAPKNQELFIDVVRELVDEGRLQYDKVWNLKISPRR
jgi:ATP-dependent DNA helicase RecQ